MKKLILALALMCVTLGVMAQQQKLTITKVKKGEEPKAVMKTGCGTRCLDHSGCGYR